MTIKKKIVLFFFFSFLSLFLWTGVIYFTLPNHLIEQAKTEQSIVLLDRLGHEVRTYQANESYDWLPMEKMPDELIDLVLMAEDQNFSHHHGIDLWGSFRSLWLNLKAKRIVSGASTITQQCYRLSHNLPRNYLGKIKALLGALKIEQSYSKNRILEFYLNSVPLGKRVIGMKRGAEVFFEKDLSQLSLAEFATLAVLPRAPSDLQTKFGAKKLLRLRDKILDRYLLTGKTDGGQVALEKKVPLTLAHDSSGWDNFHFLKKVMSEKDFTHYLSFDGRVQTTLDLYLQKEVSSILKAQIEHLKKFQVQNGAVVVMENATGNVLAYVGSSDALNLKGGQYDALQIPRQVGSTLKPFTYALALQEGRTLAKILPDIPSFYKTGLGQFLPRNYDKHYSGPRLMREALANSLNLPAVALTDELGVEKLYHLLQDVGLTLDRPAEHYGVGLTLGNAEITPLQLIEAYTSLARGGKRIKPKFFSDAPVIETSSLLDEQNTFLISHVLSDHVARREEFGDQNPFDLPFTLSVKTGTSTDFRDNWAIGYNNLFTILVWVGNMDQKPMKRVSGITGAGPVLSSVAKYLSHRMMIPRLSEVQGIEKRNICALSGKAPGKNCKHQKFEYFKMTDAKLMPCDYHQEYLVRDCREPGDVQKESLVNLPDFYQAFVFDHPEWSLEGQLQNLCPSGLAEIIKKEHGLDKEKIIIGRPLPGSLYAFDPNIPAAFQKLKLELNQFSGIKKVQWEVDQKEHFEGTTSLDWPMKKGRHHFEAIVEFEDGSKIKTPKLLVTVL